MQDSKFIPIVIGTDIFGYYWSRSMYEAYGVKSHLIGQVSMAFTNTSKIIEEIRYIDNLEEPDVFVSALIAYAKDLIKRYPHHQIILVANSDHYTRLTIENSEALRPYMSFNVPSEELLNELMVKENFYTLAEEHGLPIPKTIILKRKEALDNTIDFFPLVVKPSDSVAYNHLNFAGQEKVYRCNTLEELESIISRIREAGYTESLVIQEFVEGDDTHLWDSISYTNTKGQTQFITLAQTVLQEPDVTAVGNYTAMIARYDIDLMKQLQSFLKAINYTGFANFDLKYDPKDKQYKVFEVNIRSGRGSFYAEQMGESLAYNLVEDIVYNNRRETCHYVNEPNLFSYVPKGVLRRHVTQPELKEEINSLILQNKFHNPLYYDKDMSLKRRFYLFARSINYYKKYKDGRWNG